MSTKSVADTGCTTMFFCVQPYIDNTTVDARALLAEDLLQFGMEKFRYLQAVRTPQHQTQQEWAHCIVLHVDMVDLLHGLGM